MMKGVDGPVGRWRGGVTAKAGADEVRMNNLGGGAFGAGDLLRIGSEAVSGMRVVVGGLGREGPVGVAAEAGAGEFMTNDLGGSALDAGSLLEVAGEVVCSMKVIVGGLGGEGRKGVAADARADGGVELMMRMDGGFEGVVTEADDLGRRVVEAREAHLEAVFVAAELPLGRAGPPAVVTILRAVRRRAERWGMGVWVEIGVGTDGIAGAGVRRRKSRRD